MLGAGLRAEQTLCSVLLFATARSVRAINLWRDPVSSLERLRETRQVAIAKPHRDFGKRQMRAAQQRFGLRTARFIDQGSEAGARARPSPCPRRAHRPYR